VAVVDGMGVGRAFKASDIVIAHAVAVRGPLRTVMTVADVHVLDGFQQAVLLTTSLTSNA